MTTAVIESGEFGLLSGGQSALTGRAEDSEGPLIAGLQLRDAAAFEILVKRYGDYLYRTALWLADSEADARDAVQDCFLAVLRNIDRFEGRSSLKTWLHRMVVNAALMRMRSARRRPESPIDDLLEPVDGLRVEPDWVFTESAETMSAREEVRTSVQAGIRRLPHSYRVVLVLRDIEGRDTREVARLLDESESNVKVRLHRARAALKKLLEPLYRETSR
jgi:RNA polymerase sigma-70 factor (ECF subfamily)